jgi:hypothetical protein
MFRNFDGHAAALKAYDYLELAANLVGLLVMAMVVAVVILINFLFGKG